MDWISIFNLAAGELFGALTAAYVLAALGLAVHFGYTGLLNFGQAAFAAIGGYGLAVGVLSFGWPMWLSAIFALVCSAIFAVILGIPTLRLRADYLAIVTIAAAEVFRYAMATSSNAPITGGSNGLSQFAKEFYSINPFPDGTYGFGPFTYREEELWIRVVGWGLVHSGETLVEVLVGSDTVCIEFGGKGPDQDGIAAV